MRVDAGNHSPIPTADKMKWVVPVADRNAKRSDRAEQLNPSCHDRFSNVIMIGGVEFEPELISVSREGLCPLTQGIEVPVSSYPHVEID